MSVSPAHVQLYLWIGCHGERPQKRQASVKPNSAGRKPKSGAAVSQPPGALRWFQTRECTCQQSSLVLRFKNFCSAAVNWCILILPSGFQMFSRCWMSLSLFMSICVTLCVLVRSPVWSNTGVNLTFHIPRADTKDMVKVCLLLPDGSCHGNAKITYQSSPSCTGISPNSTWMRYAWIGFFPIIYKAFRC